jgi:hypothetical protein
VSISNWKPVGSRRTGKPRIRWLDNECSDMKVMNVKIWKELALNRNAWNDLAETAKTYSVGKLIEDEKEEEEEEGDDYDDDDDNDDEYFHGILRFYIGLSNSSNADSVSLSATKVVIIMLNVVRPPVS